MSDVKISVECTDLLRSLLQKDVEKRITWPEFFEHTWFNRYRYGSSAKIKTKTSTPMRIKKQNSEYKKQICAVSIGSLGRSSKQSKLDAIQKMSPPVINSPNIVPDYYNSVDMLGDNDCVFQMDDADDVVSRVILDASTVLEGENGENDEKDGYTVLGKN